MMLLELFCTFFAVGCFSFGGGYAILSFLQLEVERHGWMSTERFVDFIAIAQSTPGPIALNMAANRGMDMKPPQNIGATTREYGSTAIISIADNCSVDFMMPISAVIAEPARLAKSNAATTGPSSRTRVSATSAPTASAEP